MLELQEFADKLKTWVPDEMQDMTEKLAGELKELIEPIMALGLDYLTLDRASNYLLVSCNGFNWLAPSVIR